LLGAPAGAHAAVSCDFSSAVLDVSLGASRDVVTMVTDKGVIQVHSDADQVTCTGPAPTTSNTNAISVHNAPGLTDNVVGIFNANEYVPGLTDEPGDDEIEIVVNLNGGARTVLFVGISAFPGSLVFGTNGINVNAAGDEDQPDRDIDHNDSVALMSGSGSAGPDLVSAQGGRGTGGPLNRKITLIGGAGEDVLLGSDAVDELFGNDDADVVTGFGGDDVIDGGEGANGALSGGDGNDIISPGSVTDPVDAGAGQDLLSFAELTSGVSVDLEGTGAEHLDGTRFDDVLRGDDGPNRILGLAGNDQIDGRGGADDLGGGPGDDTLQIRDGEADTADCGPGGGDTVTADQLGVDLLTDCDTVTFPPPVDGGSGGGAIPGGGGGPVAPAAFGARTRVTITLAQRRIPATGPLAVRLSNANGFDVSGTLSGRRSRRIRFAARSFTVPANARKTVKLTLPRRLRRQLARTRRLSLRVTAKVRDPAGNTRTLSKTVRARLLVS
jgi:Ca2+-binding RTX toxin-like protein